MILFWESHWLYSKYRIRWCYRLCWPSLGKLFNGLVSYSRGPQALGNQCLMIWGGADIIIIEINCTVNVMCLNNPETISSHSWFMEKISSMKLVPGAKKIGDCCLKQHSFLQKMLSSWICRLRRIVLHVLRCGEHRNWCAGAMKQEFPSTDDQLGQQRLLPAFCGSGFSAEGMASHSLGLFLWSKWSKWYHWATFIMDLIMSCKKYSGIPLPVP